MSQSKQLTISNNVECSGIGIHSGQKVSMTLKPAAANTGITFVRTDIEDIAKSSVKADFRNVTQTNLGTTIENDHGVKIATIEHLLAGVWGAKIDNLIIELNSQEIPIMDGSSEPFMFLIDCAGFKTLDENKKFITITKDIAIEDADKFIKASPSSEFSVDLVVEFDHQAIGKQSCFLDEKSVSFRYDVAKARTFGFKHEIEYLTKNGLARGGSIKNAILVDDNGVANPEGLRYDNEFARHKMLDFVGDIFLAGYSFKADFKTFKSGHDINNKFLHKLFSDEENYKIL